MTPIAAKTLQACLVALAQTEYSLSAQQRQAVAQCGEAILQGDSSAIDRLREAVMATPQLQAQYEAALADLWAEDATQERAKSLTLALQHRAAPLTLEELAWEVLTAPDDFALAVQRVLNKLQPTAAVKGHPFLAKLHRAVEALDAQSRYILEELDRHPLPLKSLSYRLQQPPERAQILVDQLWKGGYIDSLEGGALRKIFTALRPDSPPNGDTYFTLTAKGHFHLHPLISRSSR